MRPAVGAGAKTKATGKKRPASRPTPPAEVRCQPIRSI